MDWIENECGPCRHYVPLSELGTGCPIEEAVTLALFLGDEVPVPEELELISPIAFHPYRCRRRELKNEN